MIQSALVHPHEAQLEVEKRQRKRGDAAIPTEALRIDPFGCVDFTALGMESNQCCGILKTRPKVCRFLAYGKGFIVATEGLEDGRALAICDVGVEQESIGMIDILQSIDKQMEAGPGARTCDKRHALRGRAAHELLRHLCCLLVIGNAAE